MAPHPASTAARRQGSAVAFAIALAVAGLFANTTRADDTTSYTYDNQGRLWKVTAPGGAVTTYTYDAAGNRTGATTTGGSATSNYATNTVIVLPLLGGFVLPVTKDPWPQ
ncbi:RHS repeat domain-containing protein [Nitrospirillum pindoramense]|nr:RHS repeat domain-containing protein [Nitrospirillum amazonense]